MNTTVQNRIGQRRWRGFTLVELMVSVTLGLIIMGAAITLFVNSKKQYHTTDASGRLQENARFAMFHLSNTLRREGFFGCLSGKMLAIENQLNDAAAFPLASFAGSGQTQTFALSNDPGAPLVPITGFDKENCVGTCPDASVTSDTMQILYLDYADPDAPLNLTDRMASESAPLKVSAAGNKLALNDIVAVTDCLTLDIFQVSGFSADRTEIYHAQRASSGAMVGNRQDTLSKPYGRGADTSDRIAAIYKLSKSEFYVKPDVNGVNALHRGSEVVVSGVDTMQLTYGIATTTNLRPSDEEMIANRFVTANNVTEWDKVVAVRVGLLVSTAADTATGEYGGDVDTRTYTVNGQAVGPFNDRRQRKVFESTIQIKNLRLGS